VNHLTLPCVVLVLKSAVTQVIEDLSLFNFWQQRILALIDPGGVFHGRINLTPENVGGLAVRASAPAAVHRTRSSAGRVISCRDLARPFRHAQVRTRKIRNS
jgi:hypothetical protein